MTLSYADRNVFKNIMAVKRYLDLRGYNVSKNTLYRAGESGALVVEPDKTITAIAVWEYVDVTPLKRKEGADKGHDELQRKINNEKLENLQLKNKREALQLDHERGKFVAIRDVVLTSVAKAVAFENALKNGASLNLAAWITLVNGNIEKSADLLQALFEWIESVLRDFAKPDPKQITLLKQESKPGQTGDEE